MEIRNEDEAWALFEKLQAGAPVDLSNGVKLSGWPNLTVYVKSGDSSLSTDMMEAFLEYQEMINRSYSLMVNGTTDLRGLSEVERESLTFRVRVTKGSSNSDITLAGVLQEFLKTAAGKMTPEQTVFVVISLGLMLAGVTVYKYRWNGKIKEQEIKEKADQRRDLLNQQITLSGQEDKRMKLFARAIQETAILGKLDELSESAAVELFEVASYEGDSKIAGIPVTQKASELTSRTTRRKSERINFSGTYKINKVDATAKKGFRAQIRDVDTGQVLTAGIADALIVGDAANTVRKAFWAKVEIEADLQAREIGDEIVNAEIITAKAIKK